VTSFEIVRSGRKTLAVQILKGKIIVRAPYLATDGEIRHFLESHRAWIETHLERSRQRMAENAGAEKLTMAEIQALADQALKVIPERVRYYAPKIGVTYGRITIRNQRTRWGSCSTQGNLNFNCLLMLTPPEVVDSVVVHELCHRKEMNHSERFYREVYRVFPEYDKWNRWLKEHGEALMARMR
jgi:predicted metal-dependent hydrolase